MAFSNAFPGREELSRAARSLDAIRVVAGVISLLAAVVAAVHLHAEGALFVALVSGGLLVFAVGMISFGRLVTQRWLTFGSQFGFSPASRRPLLDLGTDRPVLFGTIGHHPARLRLVMARDAQGRREWLEAETDLFSSQADAPAHRERALNAARAIASDVRVRVHAGRLTVRAPFDPKNTLRVLAALREAAESLRGYDETPASS